MATGGGIITIRAGQPSAEGRETMGFLNRILHRKEAGASALGVAEKECPHVALVPHWDSVDDIGIAERVVRYECESCKAAFTREEGEQRQSAGAERLRISEEERRDRLSDHPS
jgi:hypothetical protein